jgi:hypothetical protein
LLRLHLAYWQQVLSTVVAATPRVHYTVFGNRVVRERIGDTVLPALAGGPVPVTEEPDRDRGLGYYVDAALRITATSGGETLELGDGGFTTWTAQLMGDAKERCLISCISVERLATLAPM